MPWNATDILIIDPATGAATRSALGVGLSDIHKFEGGVLGPDGKIYGIPNNAPDILIIEGLGCGNPARAEATLLYNSSGNVMQYCDGANWVAIGKATHPACPGSPGSGDEGCEMPDGSIYAGLSPDGNMKMYTTSMDAPGAYNWNNGTMNYIDTATSNSSFVTGEANTTLLVGLSDAASPYEAAVYCDSLSMHGKTDWYLPSRDELDVLYDNHAAIGGY